MKLSLNFHEQLIDDKIKTAISYQKKINPSGSETNKLNSEFLNIKKKLREMEDRSRRNNFRIDGVKEKSWEETESKVKKLFEDYLDVKNVKIERAHRTGKKDAKKIEKYSKPRTIVIKLLDFKNKTEILKKSFHLKGKNIFINEDFCPKTTLIRRALKEKMKVGRASGKYAVISYDRLIIRDWAFNRKKN
ncbi:uncharacterized protein LOC136095582 [Hydra vulgaris]|uniref:uncharacterized protein LOC136095582 n=1 Tax=Hydra vulgaris TaxID=6087 RepID=UPI0032EA37AA